MLHLFARPIDMAIQNLKRAFPDMSIASDRPFGNPLVLLVSTVSFCSLYKNASNLVLLPSCDVHELACICMCVWLNLYICAPFQLALYLDFFLNRANLLGH